MNLKEKLERKEKIFATTLSYVEWPGIIKIFKNRALDFLMFDLEHGRFSMETAEKLIMMCNAMEIPAIVRAADTEYFLLSKLFDIGAEGVLVPRVETVTQAVKAYESVKFPPVGKKGCGGFSLLRGVLDVNYFNENRLLFLQMESVKGIDNLPHIIEAVKANGIIVGPTDLSIDMGIPFQYTNPLLIEQIDRVIAVCTEKNMSCGIYCDTNEEIKFWRERGMNIIWSGGDIEFITQKYNELCSFINELD